MKICLLHTEVSKYVLASSVAAGFCEYAQMALYLYRPLRSRYKSSKAATQQVHKPVPVQSCVPDAWLYTHVLVLPFFCCWALSNGRNGSKSSKPANGHRSSMPLKLATFGNTFFEVTRQLSALFLPAATFHARKPVFFSRGKGIQSRKATPRPHAVMDSVGHAAPEFVPDETKGSGDGDAELGRGSSKQGVARGGVWRAQGNPCEPSKPPPEVSDLPSCMIRVWQRMLRIAV